ncbi:MAG TPA: protein kinase [Rhodothermales bacterium]|nr:protein kinase [Rhodothermales bacterium]
MDIAPHERWQQIEAFFARAIDLPAAERADFINTCTDDLAIFHDLKRLLEAHDRAGGFLNELDAARAISLLASEDEELSDGTYIGRYRILHRIGSGGMGVVYQAHDPRLDRLVALKLLPPHLSAEEAARRRLIEEAKAASALDHPHIATIYEIGEAAGGRLFIAMAFYKGETLWEWIERGPLPIASALSLACMIADGLSAAHRRGIVHRDIKPANVIITQPAAKEASGIAKIVDFGVAKGTGAELTQDGTRLGTAAYMSPEQTRGGAIDHRTDLWSLGVVLYEMLTGVRPFRGEAEEAVVYSIRNDEPPPIERLRPEVSPALSYIVDRCLAKDPAVRYASAEGLLADLRSETHTSSKRETQAEQERTGIVVLPFVNISPDPDNEYFSDGLTEEVISDLSGIRALRVIARTSAMRLKGSDKDVPTMAHELGVRYVLEGSVRKAGTAVRISAQLIDVQSDIHLWVRKFDGAVGDIFKIQEQVARAIMDALQIHLSPGEARALSEQPIPDARAYESYLRARYEAWHFSREGLDRAKRYIETALAIVGDNELLYGTLGHITAMYREAGIDPHGAALKDVEELAEKVFALNPDSARGHWLRAFIAFSRGNLRDAIRIGEYALVLAPYDPDALLLLGYVYGHAGRNTDALAVFQRALELDPLTPLTQALPGFVAVMEGRFEDAVEPYRRYHEMEPDSPFGIVFYGWALAYDRRIDEAVSVLHTAADRFPRTAFGSYARAFAHALRGETDAALLAITPAFEAAAHGSEMFARELCHCYALVGEKEKALDWLEHEVELGMLNYPFLATHDWFLEALHDEPRYMALIAHVRATSAELSVS